MSLMTAAYNGAQRGWSAHPILAAALVSTGTLALERLIQRVWSAPDLAAAVAFLEDWMMKLQKILSNVTTRLYRDFPDKKARDAHLHSLQKMCPTEEMERRWDTVWGLVVDVKDRHCVLMQLSYKDRQGEMRELELSVQDTKTQCTALGQNITTYSSQYFRAIVKDKQGEVFRKIAEENKARTGLTPP
ncbi:hypothetical protein PHLGIDRAFT_117711 [Phlebiopsis gigantea 11061_1 CR5-6]|uniref:Uncharacterized protein n=1 Tax=Phlebiopsis gigantea (strain 11061_1 CR5-6) TaxID=745531 RepID=A0A0C3SBG7_PHLG1|nr:hypothetical protein PHLGIDRAFT_117711 [Phlebiopsis gigantea 11061_1 CR5-6]